MTVRVTGGFKLTSPMIINVPPPNPFGAEYGNWDGNRIVFSTTSEATGTSFYDGLDGFYDANTNRLYDGYMGGGAHAYRTGGYFTWGTKTSIPGNRQNGRSATVGYFNGNAYLYIGTTTASIDIYLLSNLSYVATWTLSGFTGQVTGLAYDGNGGMYATSLDQRRTLYRIDTLEPATQTVTASVVLTTLPADTEFGLCYNGSTIIYRHRDIANGKLYECNLSDGSLVQTYAVPDTEAYGMSLDYANKKLYAGGYFKDTTMFRYGT
jgi:hypothetical protein